MKLQPDRSDDVNLIQSFGEDGVRVQNQLWTGSLLVPARGPVLPWPVPTLHDLQEEHFAAIAAMQCELVIFGSGERLRFPPPALLQPLMRQRIGLETMDTRAACRTFNILAGEGRNVVAALIGANTTGG